jgi:hypothetical protein
MNSEMTGAAVRTAPVDITPPATDSSRRRQEQKKPGDLNIPSIVPEMSLRGHLGDSLIG